MITLRHVLKHFHTKVALANALGVTKSAISQWPMDKAIPERHELRLRYEIAPDIFGQPPDKEDEAA